VIGRWKLQRRLLALLLAVAALGTVVEPPLRAEAEEDPLLARAYEVRYRSLDDAYEVISAVLSPEGDVTFRRRLKTLVVQDRASVLDRVAALLESYDVPPRNAEITISLVLGTDRRDTEEEDGEANLSKEVRGILESLGNFTRWTDYEPLGSRSVTGAEGDRVVANLSEEYRVVFVLESVLEKQGKIKFERFALQRLQTQEGGTGRFEDLYVAGLTLTADRVTLVGAAQDPASKTALFLAVQAAPR
jgi:hypothetical protein